MAVLITALILAALALAVLYAVWALAFRSTARQRASVLPYLPL